MRNFILDNTNEDNIIELISRKKQGAYVMPLYAKMYHDRIDLRDINEIINQVDIFQVRFDLSA